MAVLDPDLRVLVWNRGSDHKDIHGVILVVEERPDGDPAEQRG